MKRAADSLRQINVFVCSFSEHKDMLSQRRGYCPLGNGFSIGFDSAKLKNSVSKDGFRLVPCIYHVREHNQLVGELIDDTIKTFHLDLSDGQNLKHILRSRSHEYMIRLFSLAPIIKHDTFAEEREWRAVSEPK